MTETTKLEEKLSRIREALTGKKGTRGLQAWFRREIARRTGWEPGKASVHRWVREGAEPRDGRVADVLADLEAEAEAELRSKLEGLS